MEDDYSREIEKLPNSLRIFDCKWKKIIKIENLPYNLEEFNCYENRITKIENLPYNLEEFNCYGNRITKIENLPENLQWFDCVCNRLTIFEDLPENKQTFYDFSITKIENLPRGLKVFYCNDNKITKIENLPRGLQKFKYLFNPIKFVDDISIEWFEQRGGFNLQWYNTIKRLQRRQRLRFKRNKSAKIIQKGCHNWLWKPICNDGTHGVHCRIGLKKCWKVVNLN